VAEVPGNSSEDASHAPRPKEVHISIPSIVSRILIVRQFTPSKFILLEALSATGLRSIRYAKEIPLVKLAMSSILACIRR
jgi:tRNA G26 N,N-dimethylase Trm1